MQSSTDPREAAQDALLSDAPLEDVLRAIDTAVTLGSVDPGEATELREAAARLRDEEQFQLARRRVA